MSFVRWVETTQGRTGGESVLRHGRFMLRFKQIIEWKELPITSDNWPDASHFLTAEETARLVGGEKNISSLVFSSTLIAVQRGYPQFQFGPFGGIKPIVAAINVMLQAHDFSESVANWWFSPHDELRNNACPADLVDSTDWIDQNAILQQAIRFLAPDEEDD